MFLGIPNAFVVACVLLSTPVPGEDVRQTLARMIPTLKLAEPCPALKGHLQFARIEHERFTRGEPVEILFVLENTSDQVVTTWSAGFWPNHVILVRDAMGQEPKLTDKGKLCRNRHVVDFALRDGNFRDYLHPGVLRPSHVIDLAELYELSPGTYEVMGCYNEIGMTPCLFAASERLTFTIVE
jgi:hypothetical protein